MTCPSLAGGNGELRLMTVRSEGQFNTVVYEEEDLYRGQERRDVILLHPDDMRRLGLGREPAGHRSKPDRGAMPNILARSISGPETPDIPRPTFSAGPATPAQDVLRASPPRHPRSEPRAAASCHRQRSLDAAFDPQSTFSTPRRIFKSVGRLNPNHHVLLKVLRCSNACGGR
jgi:hypothetical protein